MRRGFCRLLLAARLVTAVSGETTGYIIQTFCNYAQVTEREEFMVRAIQMADWEIQVQLPTGAVRTGIGNTTGRPTVFNTGQVILGWSCIFRETKHLRFLHAAQRAAQWLVGAQDADGAWRVTDTETETSVHTYDIRTAWSLLELHDITGDPLLLDAAKAQRAVDIGTTKWQRLVREQHFLRLSG